MTNPLSRREFVVGGGSLAALLHGMSPRTALAQDVMKTRTERLTTDVAVVGAGPGGLTAALRAAELGLNVCLFEKTSRTGGVRNGGMGPFGAGTHIQQRYGIRNYTTKDAFTYLMNFNHWRIDARLASAYINNTAHAIKWLEEQGLLFEPLEEKQTQSATEFNCFTHNFARHPDYEEFFYACTLLTNKAKSNKRIQIFMECPVTRLLKTGNTITGLTATAKDGRQIEVTANAVVVMTGGFAGNPQMVKQYTPYAYQQDLFYTFEMPNLTGDGIRMSWEAGAAASEMMMAVYKGMPIYGGPNGTRMDWSILANPNLMVNLNGERFIDESLPDRYFTANAIHRQPKGCAFLIFDSTIADRYRNQALERQNGSASPNAAGGGTPTRGGDFPSPIYDIDQIVSEARKLKYPYLFAADSLEDLCAQTGVNMDTLRQTIATYNLYCESGNDPDFYKEASLLLPLHGPKYFAAQFCCDSYGAMGGIKISPRTEVLDMTLRPIPGLYAGGSDANTMYADTYCHHLSGNFVGFAYTTGLMAAEAVVESIRGTKS